jgi:hypothetical protein
MDEAVKLGPAIDALIRHKLKVIGVTNGQRVPEDWHRLSADALVQLALRGGGSNAYKMDASDVSLVFAAPRTQARPPTLAQAPNQVLAPTKLKTKAKARTKAAASTGTGTSTSSTPAQPPASANAAPQLAPSP